MYIDLIPKEIYFIILFPTADYKKGQEKKNNGTLLENNIKIQNCGLSNILTLKVVRDQIGKERAAKLTSPNKFFTAIELNK